MLNDIMDGAPPGTAGVMQLLATAESLTDGVAAELYSLAPLPGLSAAHFLFALHQSDLIEARNSEWSFLPGTRNALRAVAAVDADTLRDAHTALLSHGLRGDPRQAGSTIPSYLFTSAGRAYHSAYSGQLNEALRYYADVAKESVGPLSGVPWLASRFAEEQQQANVLPDDATDLLFLRAMVLHREGIHARADALFWQIVRKDEVNHFTALSCDMLGVRLRRGDRMTAEGLHRRAVEIAQAIGDRKGEGVYLHNLARSMLRAEHAEIEKLFRRSLSIAQSQNDGYSVAIRKNGLGDLIAHQNAQRRSEAETLLREAVTYFEHIGDEMNAGSPLTTLARVVAMDPKRRGAAETLYRRAIDIARAHRDRYGLSLRLFGLAKLLMIDSTRRDELLPLLQESLANARQDERSSLNPILKLIAQIEREDISGKQ